MCESFQIYAVKSTLLLVAGMAFLSLSAQVPVGFQNFDKRAGATATAEGNLLSVSWPTGRRQKGRMIFNLKPGSPLIQRMALGTAGRWKTIGQNIDPVFVATVGKRDLVSQNGWNIFFDKVPLQPFTQHVAGLRKTAAAVATEGSRTVITIGEVSFPHFSGAIEITLYNGSPLVNIAAVVSTQKDSVALVYDAGLVSRHTAWKKIGWSDVHQKMQGVQPKATDTAVNEAVKYRTIIGQGEEGSVAVFPAPHQYFYPLDEAFNLKFVWHGNRYRKMVDSYGIGIRQDLYGDRRFVPWFNAPPGTRQRLNFFCLLSQGDAAAALNEVKGFTHNDSYLPLPGYKTLASHFHNEFIMNVVMAGKPVPDSPRFVQVFKDLGVDIVHLGEFHYTAHPRGPDSLRLKELHALFQQCRRLSDSTFLLLPGEEPNEFFGGHWLQFFPKPVYWIMSRKPEQPFASEHPDYGTVFRIGNAEEMLRLLDTVKGLAWTAHPRTKGSTGYPDKYREQAFFTSPRFLGAAWKPIPADLSLPRLGQRVLDLMDDMANWGAGKKALAEVDVFTIEPENEMYAHMNVNYLKLPVVPAYDHGWQPVVDSLQRGAFFSTTGEVLIPKFTVNGKSTGDTARLGPSGTAAVSFEVAWTFPLQFAELVSGDGTQTFRHRINLNETTALGRRTINLPLNLQGRKWVRLEIWDTAVNGAFTQIVWVE